MKIVIPGGSGQIGTILADHFTSLDHEVTILSRSADQRKNQSKVQYVYWDGKTTGDWVDEIKSADVVINLAGKSVNCRYNEKNKKLIMDSRVDSTTILGETISSADTPPKIWIQASTATIYAHTFDKPNDELNGELGGNEPNTPKKWNFSVKVAKTWEATADKYDTPDTRLVKLRTSLVMDPFPDGIFDTLITLVRYGLGGKAGSGKQFVSWLHYKDFIKIVEEIIQNEQIEGVVNVTSPNPIQFTEFMKNFRDAYGRKIGLPATKWMLEIGAFFMKSETELILKSRKVIPGKLLEQNYKFDFPNWQEAVKDLVKEWKTLRN